MVTTIAGRGVLVASLLLVAGALTATGQVPKGPPAKRDSITPAKHDSITPAMIALGDSVFHGQVGGGTCSVCHGADAKGTTGLAPDLTGGTWLHGDGSYAFIVGLVEQGVPDPKQFPAPMPPKGGAKLRPEQVRAVAAYVYSLSRPKTRND